MKEDFLHYLWQYKLFTPALFTVSKESLSILKSGSHNKNQGPDFLNAQIMINHQLWIGNVEIHIKSSDWYTHHHEIDANYDAVILHVVYDHDAPVYMKNNRPLPTLELKHFIDETLLKSYKNLLLTNKNWIPCEKQIAYTDPFVLHNWLERLYFERLERKAIIIQDLLEASNNNYEAVLFKLISKNFGLKLNGDAFLKLANSIDFSIIRKERFKEESFSALLFGQAGFLDEVIESDYHLQLQQDYSYLKHKYQLKPIHKSNFQFFRMRPQNFPTIRIAQLVGLYHKYESLFLKLMQINNLEGFYHIFNIEVNAFWKSHYTFDKTSKTSGKTLTKSFIDLLLINTIIPLKFVYQNTIGDIDQASILGLIQQIKSENNSIITKFLDLKLDVNSAFESQALLELKNEYCSYKKCLQCAIGNHLLKQ